MKKFIALFIAIFMMACNNTDTTNTADDADHTVNKDTMPMAPADSAMINDSLR